MLAMFIMTVWGGCWWRRGKRILTISHVECESNLTDLLRGLDADGGGGAGAADPVHLPQIPRSQHSHRLPESQGVWSEDHEQESAPRRKKCEHCEWDCDETWWEQSTVTTSTILFIKSHITERMSIVDPPDYHFRKWHFSWGRKAWYKSIKMYVSSMYFSLLFLYNYFQNKNLFLLQESKKLKFLLRTSNQLDPI